MPNTHHRRNSTVELSRVGGVYGIHNKMATVSTSLDKFANSEVELRRVFGVSEVQPYAPVGSRCELVV